MVPANTSQAASIPSWWLNLKIGLFRFGIVLKRLWWVPLLTVSVGLAGAAWFISNSPPSYLSTGRMMVSGKINISEGSMYSEELLNFFGSEAADTEGSFNRAGIKSPVVDALAMKALEAQSREELVTAIRALDRVLRAGHYWVPQWYKASHHIAYWNKFGRPETKPKYDRGIVDTWWYDAEKASKL